MAEALMITRRELRQQAMRQGMALGALDTVGRAYKPQRLWEEPDVLQRVWTDDLRQLMRDVPPFDTMFHELRALFEERMPETL
jgi:hypothetical protein